MKITKKTFVFVFLTAILLTLNACNFSPTASMKNMKKEIKKSEGYTVTEHSVFENKVMADEVKQEVASVLIATKDNEKTVIVLLNTDTIKDEEKLKKVEEYMKSVLVADFKQESGHFTNNGRFFILSNKKEADSEAVKIYKKHLC